MPKAASGDSSRNGAPGSSSISTRSRGSNLPRATCLARAASPPPERAPGLAGAQFVDQRPHGGRVGGEFGAFPIDFGFQHRHDCRTIVQPVHLKARNESGKNEQLDRCDFDFGLGEELDEVRAQVRRFARERIAPRAEEIDRSNEFPRDLWPELGDAGLLGITVPERWGGANLGYLAHIIAMEEISRASGSVGPVLRRAFQPVHEPDRAQRQRRAARPLPAEAGLGRTRGRAGHERARRGLGRGRHAAARREARRRLRPHRPQDVDHQRPGRRRGGGVRKDRPGRRAARHHRLHRREGLEGLLQRAEARQARHARFRRPANWCSRTAWCRRRTCSAS